MRLVICISEGETEAGLSTGWDGLQALGAALAVRRSLRRGGRWEQVETHPLKATELR